MTTEIPLAPIDSLRFTTLIDNVTDMTLWDEGVATRPALVPLPVAVLEDPGFDALRAEHGFAALVTLTIDGREHNILFDTGISPDGLVENMRRLELSPHDIEAIVLSHGHNDHTTGMHGLIKVLGPTSLPILIHPEFWNRRRLVIPGREPLTMPTTSRGALEGAGFEIVEDRQPSFLLDGALLVTGEVERTTGYERGLPGQEVHRHGGWEADPLTLEDQALIANVRGKGLVVITGCGHSGVVNTVRYAQRLTGEQRIHAVIGGFHLNGPKFRGIVGETCDALVELDPDVLVPSHCTGLAATFEIARRFPHAFVQNSVGTRFELTADPTPQGDQHAG